MERKEIKKNAIAHYERMIKWAKTQPISGIVDCEIMFESIWETWESEFCIYCQNFECLDNKKKTSMCPLAAKRASSCCGGRWGKMDDSAKWGTWVKRAEEVLEYIKKNG